MSDSKFYCLKCKDHREGKNAEKTEATYTNRGGKPQTRSSWKANCVTCGTNMRRFAKKDVPVAKPSTLPDAPITL